MKAFLTALLFAFAGLSASLAPGSVRAQTLDEKVLARLDALEHKNAALAQENAALRARVSRIESSNGRAPVRAASLDVDPRPRGYGDGSPGYRGPEFGWGETYDDRAPRPKPRFEVSASVLYLQPGGGNLEYGTLVSPLPVASPNWANQSLSPGFSPAFRVGLRYMPSEFNDVEANWTHFSGSASGSFAASPTQFVGPPYEIGPAGGPFKLANGSVNFDYDAVNLDAGHTFCAHCPFQLRAFGGVQLARIGETLSSTFQSVDGLTAIGNNSNSLFSGAGPRLGVSGQYSFGNFDVLGEVAGAALLGEAKNRIGFSTTSAALAGTGVGSPNNQSLTSPNATQLVPSIDAKVAVAYAFPPTPYGQFKIEAGYQASVYFNAINSYSLTQVAVPPVVGTVGVFLETQQHVQTDFTIQGPYVTGSWVF